MCVFLQNISNGIFVLMTRSCSRGGTWGRWGFPGVNCFSKHGNLAYQIVGDGERNRMQVKIVPKGQTGDLWLRSKGQISLYFNYNVNFKDFIPDFMCVLTNKRYKTYRTEFSFSHLGHDPEVGLWGAGECDGAPSIVRSSFPF